MRKLHFSIDIDAPREQVWDAMLADQTYRIWTSEFMEGSYFVGDWSEGSKMLFLGPGEDGEAGMVATIRVNRPHEFMSIKHLGIVKNGEEDTTSDAVKPWAGALEEYSFRDVDGRTRVLVEMDTEEEHAEMFEKSWPKALQRLKDLLED